MDPRTVSDLSKKSRVELIRLAEGLHVADSDVMTRVELRAAIGRAQPQVPLAPPRPATWLGVARGLVASVLEQGLNLPEAAALVRGDSKLSALPRAPAPIATVTLARIYAAQGHLQRAIATLAQVLHDEPDHDRARELWQRFTRELAEQTAAGEAEGLAATEPGPGASGGAVAEAALQELKRYAKSLATPSQEFPTQPSNTPAREPEGGVEAPRPGTGEAAGTRRAAEPQRASEADAAAETAAETPPAPPPPTSKLAAGTASLRTGTASLRAGTASLRAGTASLRTETGPRQRQGSPVPSAETHPASLSQRGRPAVPACVENGENRTGHVSSALPTGGGHQAAASESPESPPPAIPPGSPGSGDRVARFEGEAVLLSPEAPGQPALLCWAWPEASWPKNLEAKLFGFYPDQRGAHRQERVFALGLPRGVLCVQGLPAGLVVRAVLGTNSQTTGFVPVLVAASVRLRAGRDVPQAEFLPSAERQAVSLAERGLDSPETVQAAHW